MSPPSTQTLLKFLTERLDLTIEELVELRKALGEHLREHTGEADGPTRRRTLYFPSDSLGDL